MYICICIYIYKYKYTYMHIYRYAHMKYKSVCVGNVGHCVCVCLRLMPACVACWRRSLPPLVQNDMLPLHYAAANQAWPEVVSALLNAYPDAASTLDEVRCRADVGRCVLSECMFATMWFKCVLVCVWRVLLRGFVQHYPRACRQSWCAQA